MLSAPAPDRLALLAELRRKTGAAPPVMSARPERTAPTGVDALDQLLSGGLARGRLTEPIGRRSSGRTALGLAALAAATRRGETVALSTSTARSIRGARSTAASISRGSCGCARARAPGGCARSS